MTTKKSRQKFRTEKGCRSHTVFSWSEFRAVQSEKFNDGVFRPRKTVSEQNFRRDFLVGGRHTMDKIYEAFPSRNFWGNLKYKPNTFYWVQIDVNQEKMSKFRVRFLVPVVWQEIHNKYKCTRMRSERTYALTLNSPMSQSIRFVFLKCIFFSTRVMGLANIFKWQIWD